MTSWKSWELWRQGNDGAGPTRERGGRYAPRWTGRGGATMVVLAEVIFRTGDLADSVYFGETLPPCLRRRYAALTRDARARAHVDHTAGLRAFIRQIYIYIYPILCSPSVTIWAKYRSVFHARFLDIRHLWSNMCISFARGDLRDNMRKLIINVSGWQIIRSVSSILNFHGSYRSRAVFNCGYA